MSGRDGAATATAATVSPASSGQARIKFLDDLASGGSAYNISRVIDFDGDLDVDALDRSIRRCVRRHESLRTCFTVMGSELKQVITSKEPTLRRVDLSGVLAAGTNPATGEQVVEQLIRDEAAAPFNLKRAPLLRVCVLRLAERRHVLLLTLHHIIADAWSLDVLLRQLAVFYHAEADGGEDASDPLPPLSLHYADYALWQRRRLESGEFDRHLGYWRGQLDGLIELRLRTDRPRPATASHRGDRYAFALPLDLVERLRAIGRTEHATLFMTLLAGFNILLHRATGVEDVAVGGTSSGRDRPELHEMIGFFINMQVLRTRLDGNASLRANLGRTADSCQDAFEHREVPFEQVVSLRGGAREPGLHPLFQTVFQMIGGAGASPELTLPGLKTHVRQVFQEVSTFDLICTVVESEDEVSAEFGYSADLYERSTVVRLAESWLLVLQQIADHPDEPANGFPLPDLPDLRNSDAGPAAEREREQKQEQKQEQDAAAAGVAGVSRESEPTGPTERQLAHLWSELLGRPEIGRNDNFFLLGGHSLLATVLLSKLEEAFGVRLELSRFFEYRSLAELAADLDRELARQQSAASA